MNKILLLALLIPMAAFGQDVSEEAIILNQELQFLEEAANNVTILSAKETNNQKRSRPIETQSLERQYFGEDLEDDVATKAAAPKRRSF